MIADQSASVLAMPPFQITLALVTFNYGFFAIGQV